MPELIERYLAELERRLPGRRGLRRRAIAEASRHLHDAYADEQATGLDEQTAEQRAIERFGPARDVADAFRTSLPARHVTTRRVAALVTAGLAAALIATIVQETSTPDSTPRAPQAEAAAPTDAGPGTAPTPAAAASRNAGAGDDGDAAGQPVDAPVDGETPRWRFTAWDDGPPGPLASAPLRARLARASARAAIPLPADVRVTRLLTTTVAGIRYELAGWIDHGALCLALGSRLKRFQFLDCRTRAALEQDRTSWVVVADLQLGKADRPAWSPIKTWAKVTVGFVPDGTQSVELVRSDGTIAAAVAGNAFLAVRSEPRPKSRAQAVRLTDGTGSATTLRVHPIGSPVRARRTGKPLGGPTRVDRYPDAGTIGWLAAGEQRGEPLPPAISELAVAGAVIRPDPRSTTAFALYRRPASAPLSREEIETGQIQADDDLCVAQLHPLQPFRHWYAVCARRTGSPFIGLFSFRPDGSDVLAWGAVTDDVARLELYTDDAPTEVPIVDNVVSVRAAVRRLGTPFKLVAYDAAGQVIGILPDQPDFGTSPEQPDETQRRTLLDTSRDGRRVRFEVAPSSEGRTCWWLEVDRRHTTGCGEPLPPEAGASGLQPVTGRGHHLTAIWGHVPETVARIVLRRPDGSESTVPSIEGWVAHPLPQAPLHGDGSLLLTYDASGHELARVEAYTGQPRFAAPTSPPIQQARRAGASLGVHEADGDTALLQVDIGSTSDRARHQLVRPDGEPIVSVNCFTLARGRAPFGYRGSGPSTVVLTDGDGTRGVAPLRLVPPYDGCELLGTTLRALTDPYRYGGVVELAFTSEARAFYAERAAIRDLARFLGSPEIRAARARPRPPAASELASRFPAGQVVPLEGPNAGPPEGTIGVWVDGARLVVAATTPLGLRLHARFNEGRLADSNLRPRQLLESAPAPTTASRPAEAIPGPALLVSRAGPGRSWRLSDGSVLFTSRQRIQALDRPGIETTLPLASLGALAPDANRLAVVDAELHLRLLDPATLATTATIPLGPTVTGPTVRQPRRDTSTWVEVLPWRAPETIAVVVARVGPRSRLDRRELLLADPASGTVRARVDVTRYRALLATATTKQAVLLLMRDRRGSNPYVLVRIRYDGSLDTVELPQRLVSEAPGSLPVDPAGNRAFTIGRKGRIGEIDLASLAVRKHDLETDIFHPWTFATPDDVGTVDDGALPVVARYPDGSYRPALVDTHAWRITSFLTDAEPQGPPPASAGLALVGGFSGLCGSCGAGLTAYATDGTPRWHALGTRLVANTQSASSVTLVVLNHATRTGARLFLLDTRTGRTLAQLPATRYPGWVQLLAP